MNQKFHKFSFCDRQQFVESSLSFTSPTPTTPDFAQQDPLPLYVVDTSSKAVETTTATALSPVLDPWELTDTTPSTAITSAPTPTTPIFPAQLLLAPAKEIAPTQSAPTDKPTTPATIASTAPGTKTDYNSVLTVEQLQRKARAAGIKNFGRMKKNQLLAALAS